MTAKKRSSGDGNVVSESEILRWEKRVGEKVELDVLRRGLASINSSLANPNGYKKLLEALVETQDHKRDLEAQAY